MEKGDREGGGGWVLNELPPLSAIITGCHQVVSPGWDETGGVLLQRKRPERLWRRPRWWHMRCGCTDAAGGGVGVKTQESDEIASRGGGFS